MANTSKTVLFDVNGSGGPILPASTSAASLTGTGTRIVTADANGILGTNAAAVTLWTKTADTGISNSTTQSTILDTGVGSKTLTAAFLTVGKSVVFEVVGRYSTTGTPTIRFRFKLGAVTLLDSTAITTPSGVTDKQFRLSGSFTCRSTGAGGTVFSQGQLYLDGATTPITAIVNTGTNAADTTGTLAMDATVEWGTADAANVVTSTNAIFESKG